MQGKGWSSPLVISMLVVGSTLTLAFVAWERFFAPITFIPYHLLLDRTVFGACLLSAGLFMSYMLWSSYFGSFLQVVKGLSIQNASYVSQSYTVIGVLVAVSVGYLIHQTGRFKYVATFVGIPMSIIGQSLLMHFRSADENVGYILVCQIFIAIAQGVIVICDEIAILATVSHEHVAVCLAVLGIFANTGGRYRSHHCVGHLAGYSTKEANGVPASRGVTKFPHDLRRHFDSAIVPNGLPYARLAIQHAYADALLRLLAASTGVWVIGAVGVLMWRNINVKDIKQTKGNIW
ncbi:Siderophore iron transporter mirB [Pyrenophora tritici-repentis]|nr:Siderophore iron transporter mirB [Pyrenophora tritici-repentis]